MPLYRTVGRALRRKYHGSVVDRLSTRINKLPKWARDYLHHIHTFVGAEEVQELWELRDQRAQLIKLIAELKAENRRLRKRLGI